MFLLVLSDENLTANQAPIGAPVDDIRQPRWIAIRPALLPGHGGGIGRVSRHEVAIKHLGEPARRLVDHRPERADENARARLQEPLGEAAGPGQLIAATPDLAGVEEHQGPIPAGPHPNRRIVPPGSR